MPCCLPLVFTEAQKQEALAVVYMKHLLCLLVYALSYALPRTRPSHITQGQCLAEIAALKTHLLALHQE